MELDQSDMYFMLFKYMLEITNNYFTVTAVLKTYNLQKWI